MERFGLSRLDLMRMTWSELTMLFDATYEEETPKSKPSDVREATDDDIRAWI